MVNTMLRTSSGTIYFDALLHADHNSNVTPTEHPVQYGAAVSDHAFVQPQEITLEVGMTDVIGGDGASVRAYHQFKALMQSKEAVTVVTRLGTYQNMLLVSLSAPDDYTTMNALRATLIFKEIRIVSAASVQVQKTVSGSKNPGTSASTASSAASSSSASSTSPATPKTEKPASTEKQSVLAKAAETIKKAAANSAAKSSAATRATTPTKVLNKVKETIATVKAKLATAQSTSKATTKPSKAVAAKVNALTKAQSNKNKVSLLK